MVYLSKKGIINFLKSNRRRKKVKRRVSGFQRYKLQVSILAKKEGRKPIKRFKNPFRHFNRLPPRPELPPNIKFLAKFPNLFSEEKFKGIDNGRLYVPKCFSLLENYEESFDFLKHLFLVLYEERAENVVLDYVHCNRIDVDASICMDLMLAEYSHYLNACTRLGHRVKPYTVRPENFNKPDIVKVLFSIGAYANLRGFKIKYDDIEELSVLVGSHDDPLRYEKCEVHTTNIVEYIKRCLARLNRELNWEAEDSLYKVLGEIMANAEEHSSMPQRFAIGFFQETHNQDEHFGIVNFSIFNLGDTIYDKFKSPDCPNLNVKTRMTELSSKYTNRGWFKKAKFEEETLWTLYALQDGVTSMPKKRGNGSIQYIENFFKLKGDMVHDNISKLVIISGNTRIMFDGKYEILEKEHLNEKRKYKSITFNNTGNIGDQPDDNFVTFAPNFFPGTIISARILIKSNNIDS